MSIDFGSVSGRQSYAANDASYQQNTVFSYIRTNVFVIKTYTE